MAEIESVCDSGDEAELLRAARSGDEAALERLWVEMRAYLLEIARRDLGADLRSKLDASDIVQQSLLEAQPDLPDLGGTNDQELRSWLRQLVQHNLEDAGRHFRLARRRSVHREESISPGNAFALVDSRQLTGSTMARRSESDRLLLAAIARLPELRRRIVLMRHRDGLHYCEIARRLDIAEPAARKHWSRAVVQLRELLGQDGESGVWQP